MNTNTSDSIWESTLVELNIVEMYLAFSVVAESTEVLIGNLPPNWRSEKGTMNTSDGI